MVYLFIYLFTTIEVQRVPYLIALTNQNQSLAILRVNACV